MEPMSKKTRQNTDATHGKVVAILDFVDTLCEAWGWDFQEIVGCGRGHYEGHAAAAMIQRCMSMGSSTAIGVAFEMDHSTADYWMHKYKEPLPEYPHPRLRLIDALEAVGCNSSIFDFKSGRLEKNLSRAPFDVWERLLVWAHLTCVEPRMSVKDAARYTTRRGHSTLFTAFDNAERMIVRYRPPAWQVELYRSWRPSPVVTI